MKIWTLMENTAGKPGLHTEHGLSLYIETGDKRILFDAGQSGAFAENAQKLGIDLETVDLAVLSHGHYDHGGGLKTFLEINSHARVYVSRYAFGEYRNASGKYIGLDQSLKDCERLVRTEDLFSLREGITLLSCNGWKEIVSIDSAGLQKMQKNQLVADDFLHEQYLLIEENGRRFLFSGCSHKGILNIQSWISCDVLVGGFHFMKLEAKGEKVSSAAQALLQGETEYYTCHCTGLAQYQAMKKAMGDRLHYLSAGSCIER